MASDTEQTSSDESEESRRAVYRVLYLPWAWLAFLPWLGISTVSFGAVAVGLAKLSPRAAFHMGTLWSWLLCRANWTSVTIEGREKADPNQSYVIMSNHQSNFDVLAFYGHWGRQFRWVMKEELRNVPGLGWYCAAGGHVFVDRSNREKSIASLEAAKERIRDGISVVFFPEGRRSRDGRLQDFKTGGFRMAQDLGLPILPVSISGARHVLPDKTLKLIPGRIKITIHDPVLPDEYAKEDRKRLMEVVRQRICEGLTPFERGE